MFHPSCPHCGSRKTIKYAFPRWKCTKDKEGCGKTFTLKNPDGRNRTAIAGYVLDRSTYARLGERWGIDRSTAYRRVKRALKARMPLVLRTKRSLKSCDGICLLDGKHLRILGKTHTLFVAWDRGLGTPLHFILQEGGESSMGYWKLLMELKRIGYKPWMYPRTRKNDVNQPFASKDRRGVRSGILASKITETKLFVNPGLLDIFCLTLRSNN